MLDAIEEVHSMGYIHRDIKPVINILFINNRRTFVWEKVLSKIKFSLSILDYLGST